MPIIAGARLLGKEGVNTIGLMSIQTSGTGSQNTINYFYWKLEKRSRRTKVMLELFLLIRLMREDGIVLLGLMDNIQHQTFFGKKP